MSGRHRTRVVAQVGGTAVNTSLGPSGSSWNQTEVCDDVVGNMDGTNPFLRTISSNYGWSCMGRSRSAAPYWTYNGYVRTIGNLGYLPVGSSEPSDNYALSEALAKTNPNKAQVDSLVFFAELREIPRLLQYFAEVGFKQFRDKPIRSLAEAHLTWEYGIKPFTADLVKTLDFVNHTEKRFRELKNLQKSNGGLGRVRTIWKDEVTSAPIGAYLTSLYSEGNYINYVKCTRRQKWVSTRWIPQIDLSTFSDDDLRARANRIVFGTDFSFSTLWEAMPWSWLIDWFSNVGDIVELSRNTIPVKHDGSCVMRSAITFIKSIEVVFRPAGSTARARAGRNSSVTLKRTPMYYGPLPEFNLPFLDGRQTSILSSLGALKFGPIGKK